MTPGRLPFVSSKSFGTWVATAILAFAGAATAQTIDTVAGGFTGDGGPATAAYLFYPDCQARASNGDVYISDTASDRIRRVRAATGIIDTVVGTGESGFSGDGGPGTQARIRSPRGLAFDSKGLLYFSDSANNCVRRYDPTTGIVGTFAGSPGEYDDSGDGGPATQAKFGGLYGLAFSPAGDLYVVDQAFHRVRRIEAATGLMRPVAGVREVSGFTGDGGPATQAQLNGPVAVTLDAAGNLYIADSFNNRIRVVAAATGNIRTLAGNGQGVEGSGGDGGPATQAVIWTPTSVAVRGTDLLIASFNQRIQKVPLAGGNLTTLVGEGPDRGEGVPASQAQLNLPVGLAVDPAGNVYWIDEGDGRSRVFRASDATVRTLAGSQEDAGTPTPAREARIVQPTTVALDASGNLFIGSNDYRLRVLGSDGLVTTIAGTGCCYQVDVPGNETGIGTVRQITFDGKGGLLFSEESFAIVRRYDLATKKVSLVAGTLYEQDDAGDGGPATQAHFRTPDGVAVDAAGNVYVADRESFRIRKIDANGVIRTVAGTGQNDSSGDGGPASQASFQFPGRLTFDPQGRLYVVEPTRIRRIDFVSDRVTTVAGNGSNEPGGDGGPATQAGLGEAEGVALDAQGRLYISTPGSAAIRVVDTNGVIRSLNDPGQYAFIGDGGPVSQAGMYQPEGLTLDAKGALYFADRNDNRIRKVNACVPVGAFQIQPVVPQPFQDTFLLSWTPSEDAFRYDVFLDTVSPPVRKIASDVTGTSFEAAGLAPGTTYFVSVTAKGDPYCPSVATRSSSVQTFATSAICGPPGGFTRVSPADGATNVISNATLSWTASGGAQGYDVFIGSSDPPPFYKSVTSTSTGTPPLAPGGRYFWRVAALAACDSTRSLSTTTGSFTVSGTCAAPGSFALSSPANAASGQPFTVTLRWAAAPGAAAYDVFFGTGASPPLLADGVLGTSYRVTGLAKGTNYTWRVVARSACDATKTATAGPFTFTSAANCPSPAAPTLLKPTGTLLAGQSYVLDWTAADGVDAGTGGFYRVERSLDAGFGTILDRIETGGRSASFTYASAGTVYHRVTAVTGCGTTSSPSNGASGGLSFALGKPRVVIARQPEPALVQVNGSLGAVRTTFDLRNVSNVDFVGAFNTIQPIPFFRPTELTIALRARETKTYTLEYTGVPANAAARFDGLLLVTSLGSESLDLTPYATVALTVTPEISNAAPVFGAEAIAFPATPSSSDPPAISVTLRNPGSKAMALSGEVGPEVWLRPDPEWNRTALAAGETRTITLRCQRIFGAAGGAFPRYTYFTVRTKEGASARLLVRDEIPPDDNLCASRTRLAAGAPSLIVPSIVKATSALGNTFVSKLQIGNLGTDDAVVDLFLTPDGAQGFDCARVRAKRLTLPGGDVLSLTDPLGALFGTSGSGQLEIRSERLSQLKVTGGVEAAAKNGGAFGFAMPAFPRGAGAVSGQPQVVSGLVRSAAYRTNMILAETTGDDDTEVTVTLYGANGSVLGSPIRRTLPPYGKTQFAMTDATAGAFFEDASAVIEVVSGLGAVQALATVIDNTNDDASTYLGRPANAAAVAGATRRAGTRPLWLRPGGASPDATGPAFVIPAVANAYASTRIPGAPWTFQTSLVVSNITATAAPVTLTYRPIERGSPALVKLLTIPPRGTLSYANALVSLFGIGASEKSNGPVTIEGDTARVVVAARVFSKTDAGTLGDALPVVPVTTENATGARNAATLESEGLEHSIDLSRGARSNIILTEFLGKPARVILELWEKGDRRVPISSQTVDLAPLEKRQLSPAFAGDAGLKDRTNVRLTVRSDPASEGKVVGLVTRIDNLTGDTKNALMSAVGEASSGSTIGF